MTAGRPVPAQVSSYFSSTKCRRRRPSTSRSTSCHLPCPSRNSKFDQARKGAFAGNRDRMRLSPSASWVNWDGLPQSSAEHVAPRSRLLHASYRGIRRAAAPVHPASTPRRSGKGYAVSRQTLTNG
jgi:hypothetical protein